MSTTPPDTGVLIELPATTTSTTPTRPQSLQEPRLAAVRSATTSLDRFGSLDSGSISRPRSRTPATSRPSTVERSVSAATLHRASSRGSGEFAFRAAPESAFEQAPLDVHLQLEYKEKLDKIFAQRKELVLKEMEQWMAHMRQMQGAVLAACLPEPRSVADVGWSGLFRQVPWCGRSKRTCSCSID